MSEEVPVNPKKVATHKKNKNKNYAEKDQFEEQHSKILGNVLYFIVVVVDIKVVVFVVTIAAIVVKCIFSSYIKLHLTVEPTLITFINGFAILFEFIIIKV